MAWLCIFVRYQYIDLNLQNLSKWLERCEIFCFPQKCGAPATCMTLLCRTSDSCLTLFFAIILQGVFPCPNLYKLKKVMQTKTADLTRRKESCCGCRYFFAFTVIFVLLILLVSTILNPKAGMGHIYGRSLSTLCHRTCITDVRIYVDSPFFFDVGRVTMGSILDWRRVCSCKLFIIPSTWYPPLLLIHNFLPKIITQHRLHSL